MKTVANQCPAGNTQGQSCAPVRLLIHGPTWKNTMPLDAHALTVVLPFLTRAGWLVEADDRLNRIDVRPPKIWETTP